MKKGDGNICDSDIGTTLLNCMYRVLSSIMSNKLTAYAEKIIGHYQNGFKMNGGTIDG